MNHAEQSIAYYLVNYSSCRLEAVADLLFSFGDASSWNAKGQLENCSSEEPREPWYPEGSDPQFHIDNKAFEREYYAKHTWHNWYDAFRVSVFHIGQVPDHVSDDWLAVCIEVCQCYLETHEWTPKIAISFDYSGVSFNKDGTQTGKMQRVMEPWLEYAALKLDKPAVTIILKRLLDMAAERGIL